MRQANNSRAGASAGADSVAEFYGSAGWETEGGIALDTRLFVDLRECTAEYQARCRRRVARHIPERGGNLLDVGSGPLVFPEHAAYSENFSKHYCLDFSQRALADAERRLGGRGVSLRGDFLDVPLEENFFDCVLCLHTLYHIDAARQEEAVCKMLRAVRPGKPVIVVYSRPRSLTAGPRRALRLFREIVLRRPAAAEELIYFHAHPLEWWDRFRGSAEVRVYPWRALTGPDLRSLVPNGAAGRALLAGLYALEERFPDFFARHGQYPLVVLTKKGGQSALEPAETP